MNCSEVQELLSPYADSMLEAGEMDLITEHLGACSDCFSEYQSLQALLGVLKSVEDQELPKGFNDRLMNRLRPPERKKFVVPAWFPVGAVAAILIVLFIGFSPENIQDFRSGVNGQGVAEEELTTSDKVANGDSNGIEMALQGSSGITEENAEKKAEISIGSQMQEIALLEDTLENPPLGLFGEQIREQTDGGLVSKLSDTPNASLRTSVANEFRGDRVLERNGSRSYGDELFSTSALVPFASQAEEPISVSETPRSYGTGQEDMRISVISLDRGLERLEGLANDLGGKVVSSKVEVSGRSVSATEAFYTVSIPCNAVRTFVDSITIFGNLTENKLEQGSALASGADKTIEELKKRKADLSNQLMHSSDAAKMREFNQEIAVVDREIVSQNASSESKPCYQEINILVEVKGN